MGGTNRLSSASTFLLSTLDPAAPPTDLEPLARLIPDHVRVFSIGESTHGSREFYALRHRLVRFLVERMDFTALAWESGFPEAFAVDDYIHSRHADLPRAQADGMTMHMGRCQEFADLLDWLRARNASSAPVPVHFYGLDLPGSSAGLNPVRDVIAPYVESVDPGFRSRLARLRQLAAAFGPTPAPSSSDKVTLPGTAAVHQYVALPAADRNELTALLADLAARFDALRRTYVERSDPARYDIVRQHLRVTAQLDLQLRAVAALMAGDPAACEANIRDLTMADTVEWVLAREPGRVIVLAHNGHIQRTPISTYAGPIDTLGVHLARRLGDRYLTLGTTCNAGDIILPRTVTAPDGSSEAELVIRDLPPAAPDTLDGLLHSAFAGQTALLDLRSLDPHDASVLDATRKMRVLDQPTDIDVRRSFDLLVHVPRISLWTSPLNPSLPDLRAANPPAPGQ